MNQGIDVIEVLRRANPVPLKTVDESTLPIVGDLMATFGRAPTTVPITFADPRRPRERRSWTYAAAVAALAAAVVALIVVPRNQDDPVDPATTAETQPAPQPATTQPTAPPADRFVGVWRSTDTDGSSQTMEILSTSADELEVVLHDEAASAACAGAPATITGTARLETAEILAIAQPLLTCDDGTTPGVGLPPQEQIAGLTFELDRALGELVYSFGVVWRREGSATVDDGTAAPASTVTVPPDEAAAAKAVIAPLIDALNTSAADDRSDDPTLPDAFTDDATIAPFEGWQQLAVTDRELLRSWALHLRSWDFEGVLQDCWTDPDAPGVLCSVRARWQAVLAEADEYWNVSLVGDRIQTLTIRGPGTRFGDPTLPLSLAELVGWEDWLQQTDPENAARLIPGDDPARPLPVVPRYDPAHADEITVSIELYLAQRPSGDTIAVTADLIDFGEGLVGLIGNMDRADGRTYVIGGRYRTEADLFFAPQDAVLAAFDDVGNELWRTELDATPVQVDAVGDDVWVLHQAGALSRIDSSDGRVVDQIGVPSISSMVTGFGSVWIQTNFVTSNPMQLIRVSPDLTTTTVDLPAHQIDPDNPADAIAAGAGAIWVPLGAAGVAVVDPVSLEVAVISRVVIGHDVLRIAFDGDVAYVASLREVTAIVGGEVRATVVLGELGYLGSVEGVVGALTADGFVVLAPDAPMKVDVREVSAEGPWGASEIDGEAWKETGRNYDLIRVEFSSAAEEAEE